MLMTLDQLIGQTQNEEALIELIRNSIKRRAKISTGIHRVFELEGYPDILVKEVNIDGSNGLDYPPEDLENIVLEEHKLTSAYLHRYIPHTVFIRMDIGSGENQYLIQQRVDGLDDSDIDTGFMNAIESPESMMEEFEDFFEAYRKMRNAGDVIEDQFMIDPAKHKIHVVDTNTLRRPCTMEELEPLTEYLGDAPKSLDAIDLLKYLQKHFKSARDINIEDEHSFLKKMFELQPEIEKEMRSNGYYPQIVSDALALLIQSIMYFPPKYFKDNYYTMKIRERFSLSKFKL
jgi:hypothetical protein